MNRFVMSFTGSFALLFALAVPGMTGGHPKTGRTPQPLLEIEKSHDGRVHTRFEVLDMNHDGYLNKQEAKVLTALIHDWGRIDQNRDDQIDLAEFTIFENRKVLELPARKTKHGAPERGWVR